MPRDIGTGLYHYPEGTPGNPGQTVFSARYNTFINDLSNTLNQKLPINMGGTGGDSAAVARDNLDVEVAAAVVTNYDSHVWESGSFQSTAGATGAPNAINGFGGVAIVMDSSNVIVQAMNLGNGEISSRTKSSGVWGSWMLRGDDRVAVAGDTMTGDLAISKASPVLTLNKAASGQNATLYGATGSVVRWAIHAGDDTAETGSNAGSDFMITAYNDAGTLLAQAFRIVRSGGASVFQPQGTFLPDAGMAAMSIGFTGAAVQYGTMWRARTAGTSYPAVFVSSANATVGSIANTDTVTTYNTSSDERLKQDLKSFDAGNIVDDTNVYDFAWKSTGERSYGIIAQQAKDIYPAAVTHDEKVDWWGIDYSKYVPVILQELKALRVRVAELENRLEAGATPA